MTPNQSKLFFKILAFLALIWGAAGAWFTRTNATDFSAYFQIYLLSLLDLSLLILIAWLLFYVKMTKSIKTIQIFILFTFKLVCLFFLAITLKRLRNASGVSLILGAGFVGIGPLISSLLVSRFKETQQG